VYVSVRVYVCVTVLGVVAHRHRRGMQDLEQRSFATMKDLFVQNMKPRAVRFLVEHLPSFFVSSLVFFTLTKSKLSA
jgi:hypothetical protein